MHSFITMHHLVQIVHQFSKLPQPRKLIVSMLLAASTAFVRACRIVSGQALEYARASAPIWVVLWAGLQAALMLPLHALAQHLVYAKVMGGHDLR